VSDEDVTDGAVWRVNMQTPLHEYYSKCMSRYQGTSKLIDKNDVLLYDELCVNVSLLDNTDGKSIPIEENIGERANNTIHLYAAPRSDNLKFQISEGKFQGLGSEMNNRVNFYKYTATFDDHEIIPLTEHTVKSAAEIDLTNHREQVKLKVHPPKPTFFLKSPFRVLDDSKTPYSLGFNAGDVIFLQSKRIMRAKAKVQDFHIEPGATIHAVKTIVITIEETSAKKRQLQLPIPEAQWLVSDLKFALFEHTCILPSSIVLFTKDGVEMQNDDFVSQYEVIEDSVIFMELHDKPFVDERHPQTIVVHFDKLPSKSPLRQHSSSKHQPIVVDLDSADEDDKNHRVKHSSNNSSASKNLKRKLDFDNVNEHEPPKKKVLWRNSSDSASENDDRRKNTNDVQDDSHNSEDEDYSGVNDGYQSDEESSEDKSNSDESKSRSSLKQKQAPKSTKSNNNIRPNHNHSTGYKLKTNEPPKQKAGSFPQRTDKSRLTHSAIITHLKQFPHGAEIKDIQGVSVWENQMIYFILMSTNDGLRSAWIGSELLSDLSPKVLISYLERKMQFRK
jgi:hypothetical protein